jgi:hypothetical protein
VNPLLRTGDHTAVADGPKLGTVLFPIPKLDLTSLFFNPSQIEFLVSSREILWEDQIKSVFPHQLLHRESQHFSHTLVGVGGSAYSIYDPDTFVRDFHDLAIQFFFEILLYPFWSMCTAVHLKSAFFSQVSP